MATASDRLVELDLCAAVAAVAAGDVDPVELTEAYLARIDDLEPRLNAYTTVTAELAREQAGRAADDVAAGRPLGPLHGVPIGLKDLIDTAGVRTTYGSALYRDHRPDADATVAALVRAAGAVLLGKHATHELAWGGRTDNPHFGVTRNPHDPQRIPGGSSGGSAASVVARTALASVGTDTCGSVRIPAALSGCVALKPTRGRVSLAGVMPLARSLDHAGPITRTVDDAALLFSVLAGPDPGDSRTLDDPPPVLRDLLDGPPPGKVGWLRGWFEAVLDPGVAAAVRGAVLALAAAGCEVVELHVPYAGPVVDHVFRRVRAEGGQVHAAAFAARPEAFGPDLTQLLSAPAPTPRELAESEATLARFSSWIYDALTLVDVVVCATVPAPAPRIGQLELVVSGTQLHVEWMLTRLTMPFDVTGLPALSVPWGTAGGLPVGVQVAGRRLDEAGVLAAGRLLERAAPPQPRPRPGAAAVSAPRSEESVPQTSRRERS